jgi:hypothetical protein
MNKRALVMSRAWHLKFRGRWKAASAWLLVRDESGEQKAAHQSLKAIAEALDAAVQRRMQKGRGSVGAQRPLRGPHFNFSEISGTSPSPPRPPVSLKPVSAGFLPPARNFATKPPSTKKPQTTQATAEAQLVSSADW